MDQMFQSLHNEIAKASAPRAHVMREHHGCRGRGHPPSRRVRGHAAGVLASLARRLDAERARRALA
jgi:hypothetical protein